MTEVVETTSNVTLQNPFWRGTLGQNLEALFDGIGGRAFGPKAVGIGVCQGLRDGFQSELP